MRWLSLWAAATIPPTAIRFFRIFLAQPSIGGPKRGPARDARVDAARVRGLVYSAIFHPIHETI